MTVTVGRIVHYVESPPGEAYAPPAKPHPAIVTKVWSDTCVNLTVFFDGRPPEPRTSVMRAPDWGGGQWDWPPRA